MTLPKKDPNYLSQISQPTNLPPLMEANAVKRKKTNKTQNPNPKIHKNQREERNPQTNPKPLNPSKRKMANAKATHYKNINNKKRQGIVFIICLVPETEKKIE